MDFWKLTIWWFCLFFFFIRMKQDQLNLNLVSLIADTHHSRSFSRCWGRGGCRRWWRWRRSHKLSIRRISQCRTQCDSPGLLPQPLFLPMPNLKSEAPSVSRYVVASNKLVRLFFLFSLNFVNYIPP